MVRYGILLIPSLNFGWKKMASISTFARNFAKGKNGQHSNFRKEFREFLAYPKHRALVRLREENPPQEFPTFTRLHFEQGTCK